MPMYLSLPKGKRCWGINDHTYFWSILWTHGDTCAVQAQPGQEQAQEQLSVPF